jgi:hypothetical protein
MIHDPKVGPIGSMFKNEVQFFVPKYQRAYAWDSNSVQDFLTDVNVCYQQRTTGGTHKTHFFGGILSVSESGTGAFHRSNYEIIDGQQRLVTTSLLVNAIISAYGKLLTNADPANKTLIQRRIKYLKKDYFEFELEEQKHIVSVPVFTLSKADGIFYFELIRGNTPTEIRDSHRLLNGAYNQIESFISKLIDPLATVDDKMESLDNLAKVVEHDFLVLHIITDTREDAYKLFQVINDRGITLSTGDLLRASTLEKVDSYNNIFDSMALQWDKILADKRTVTDSFLMWIYESHVGERSRPNSIYDNFRDQFFQECQQPNLTLAQAQALGKKVKATYSEIQSSRKLLEGEWLFNLNQPVTEWDLNRLKLLIPTLKHSLCIPLLLAASKLKPRNFSEIIQMIEKVYFRYKLVCNQHINPLRDIYATEAKAIRANPTTYRISSLRTKLRTLLDENASDDYFKNILKELKYGKTGPNRKIIKYFLLACEYYWEWYKTGARGAPKCLDKTRVYTFSGISIEHIYPQNAPPSRQRATLEPIKHKLGNLTLLDPGPNSIGGNDIFSLKKVHYTQSSFEMTKDIGTKARWTKPEITTHLDELMSMAVLIFKV